MHAGYVHDLASLPEEGEPDSQSELSSCMSSSEDDFASASEMNTREHTLQQEEAVANLEAVEGFGPEAKELPIPHSPAASNMNRPKAFRRTSLLSSPSFNSLANEGRHLAFALQMSCNL